MKSKNKLSKKKLFGLIAAALAVVGMLLWLILDAVSFTTTFKGFGQTSKNVSTYNGMDVFLGIEDTTTFNFFGILIILLPVVGAGMFLGSKKSKLIGALCLVLATVLVFLTPTLLKMFYVDEFKEAIETVEFLTGVFSTGVPVTGIISGCIMALAAVVGTYSSTLRK